MSLSRRRFVSGLAAALGYVGVGPAEVLAQGAAGQVPRGPRTPLDLDKVAKLNNNENPYGPPESVVQAMNSAWKWVNRYGVPDGGLMEAIQTLHGVKAENIILGAGSGEILDVVGTTFLLGGRKVLGVEPSYTSVYQHATSIKSEAIKLPLNADYSQNIPALIAAANKDAAQIGFVYLCNPNNPTGMIVTKSDVKQLLDGIPRDMPVLIDEAYHHFVDSPQYATSIPYALEGRPVIVARTFSKIAGLAAMRLGYGIAPAALVQKMRPFATGSQNVLVKFGGAASIQDTAAQQKVKALNTEVRNRTIAELRAYGYDVLPSEANFFMVGIRRNVQEVSPEFSKRNVLVGRPFPPMVQHLRVSVGTANEMTRFMTAFKEIFPQATTAGGRER
jgi:histidinol-phosphate aminotransferase